MYYKDQLVLSGKINDVGGMVRENSGESYRLGLETGIAAKLSSQFTLAGNATISQNKNLNYIVEGADANGTTVYNNLGNTPFLSHPALSGISLPLTVPVPHFGVTVSNQYVGKQYLDNTEDAQLKLPGYNVLDILANYQLKISRYDLGLNLMVNNLLNRKYANNGYVYDGAMVYPQAGINFMLGMTLKFQ
ncbi:hypothetical protein BPO_1698 [Bergeyella porcorum]|uniref:TonB-dependent receptor-like beta-barrel domain-containing protein n=1 Tax=Bergeyella porcorum TaxID=1735111 RepID=A0AAU0F333_9FLAO